MKNLNLNLEKSGFEEIEILLPEEIEGLHTPYELGIICRLFHTGVITQEILESEDFETDELLITGIEEFLLAEVAKIIDKKTKSRNVLRNKKIEYKQHIYRLLESEEKLPCFPIIWRDVFNFRELQIVASLVMRKVIYRNTNIDKIKTFIKGEIYRRMSLFRSNPYLPFTSLEERYGEIPIKWEDGKYQELEQNKEYFRNNYLYDNINFIQTLTKNDVKNLINLLKIQRAQQSFYFFKNFQIINRAPLRSWGDPKLSCLTKMYKELISDLHNNKLNIAIANEIQLPQDWKENLNYYQFMLVQYIVKELVISKEIHFKMSSRCIEMAVVSELLSLIVRHNSVKYCIKRKVVPLLAIPRFLDFSIPNWFKPDEFSEFKEIKEFEELDESDGYHFYKASKMRIFVLWPEDFNPKVNVDGNYIVPFYDYTQDDVNYHIRHYEPEESEKSVPCLPIDDFDGSYDFSNWPDPVLLENGQLSLPLRKDRWWDVPGFAPREFWLQKYPIIIEREKI